MPSPPSSPASLLSSPRPFPSLFDHAKSICPPVTTYHPSPPPLSTLDPAFDALLSGGLPTHSATLTELCGPAASGKTQFALQLALSAAQSSSAIYVVTEAPFPSSRLRQMASARLTPAAASAALGRVVVERAHSAAGLEDWAAAGGRLPYLLRATGARLVVVDSVAAPFRHEIADALERSAALSRTAAGLFAAVRDAGAALMCVNHVAARMGVEGDVPALGHGWDVCVGMRLWFQKGAGKRVMRVARAPHIAQGSVEFVLDESGVRGVEEDE